MTTTLMTTTAMFSRVENFVNTGKRIVSDNSVSIRSHGRWVEVVWQVEKSTPAGTKALTNRRVMSKHYASPTAARDAANGAREFVAEHGVDAFVGLLPKRGFVLRNQAFISRGKDRKIVMSALADVEQGKILGYRVNVAE